MKQVYIKPQLDALKIQAISLMDMSETENENLPVYPSDPQDPSNALSKGVDGNIWDDEEDI